MFKSKGLDCRARRRASALAVAAGACIALGSPAARAVDGNGCLPPVIGVPWSGAAPTVTALDDLKWNGAFAYEWAMGGPRDGEFRNLLSTDAAGNKTLYVYYKSLVHRSVINYGDGIQFGISYDDSSSGSRQTIGQIINVTFGVDNTSGPNLNGQWTAPTVDGSGNPIPTAPGGIHLAQQLTTYNGTTPVLHNTTDLPVPTWLSPPAPSTPPVYFWILKDPADSTLYFVVQAAIPLSTTDKTVANGLFVDPSQFATPSKGIPFWGDELSMEIDPTGGTKTVPRPWPNLTYTAQGRLDGDKYQPPSPDHWGLLQPAAAPTCTGGGLRFGPGDITNNGGYLIDLYAKDSLGNYNPSSNTPRVNVTNVGPTVTPSDIHATFNIAPMGSQDAHSVSWQPLNDTGNAIKCTGSSTGSFDVCKPKPVAGKALDSAASGGSSAFTLTANQAWKPDWSYICAIIGDDGVLYKDRSDIGGTCATKGQWFPSAADVTADNVLHEHQCMLVQLHSTNNSVQFDTQSQFVNMHVAAHASHFEEKARIDTSGVPKIPGKGGHWVYIVVETRNMLHDIPGGITSPYTNAFLEQLLYGCEDVEGVCNRGNTPVFDWVAAYFPTTVMHVYHDTGLHRIVNHKKVEVYEPQSSYGYFVSHDGKLYGWDVAIKGARKVAPNVYRLWIKDDQAVSVTTSIDALEQPRCDGEDDAKKK